MAYDKQTEKILSLNEWGKEEGQQLSDLSKVNADKIVEVACNVGKHLQKGMYKDKDKNKDYPMKLKMNQIRKFLDAVRRIEADLKGNKTFEDVKDTIILLRPKLAYAAGREKKVKPLMNVLDPAIKSGAQSEKNFMMLLRLIESIIAYHRFYDGTN